MLRILLASTLLLFMLPAAAVIETYEFSDPTLEERYQELSAELRCPKCQNQNIADSNAPIAQDLRKTLHMKLEEGASDSEILDYMVARYGEFVRYRPSFGGANTVLWLAPVGLLAIGGLVLLITGRRKSAAPVVEAGLQADDRERVSQLLEGRDA